ncbi:NUDIX domain-containing protein [Rhodococcus sp. NPDC127528]|uniref:NUDIX hydrolase n=1 Tax=unclassified Rhodococcus (in: high G+C Gram-positive bacteria) TaxID=192944 RepID=UPI003642A8C9
MAEWTDPSGSPLTAYPRPSVAVDVAVLTCSGDALQVVVVEHRRGLSALPGTFLHQGERLADAAVRALRDKAHLTGTRFRQLALFDDPDRDDRGWVISMAHTAAMPFRDLPEDALLVDVHDGEAAEGLAFDHAEMVRLAVDDLRARYAERVDPDHLLGESFTVLQLRRLYEVVFGSTLQKDSFRRHVRDALEATERKETDGAGRPAEVFRRKGDGRLSAKAAALFAK